MKYPKVGEKITTKKALKLLKHFDMDMQYRRLRANPQNYKSWKFDGISGVWDEIAATITGVDTDKLTNLCALPHDLAYAYGALGDERERKEADKIFKDNLIHKAKMDPFWAKIFYKVVRIGGQETLGLSFSWGFATDPKRIEISI